jgi:hypothetical protein
MKILLSSNTAWYLWKFRLSLAMALKAVGHEGILSLINESQTFNIQA